AVAQDGESTTQQVEEVVVEVGPNGRNVFEPETVHVKPGTTVRWVWQSEGHNVHATDVPEGAEWDVQTEITGPPHEYSYTFDGPQGTYHYVCDPHVSVGMEGDVVVTTEPPEDTGYQSILPDNAKTLGVAAVGGLGAVLGLTYFFMRYGGEYGEGEMEE
ncbi:MAG: plastocyanin/azurin family copper-binding protein, partial [Halobacterium sp.]